MPSLKTHEMLLLATGASGELSTAAVRDIILREHVHCRESFNREKKNRKKKKKTLGETVVPQAAFPAEQAGDLGVTAPRLIHS
jgi:hypothetical protein